MKRRRRFLATPRKTADGWFVIFACGHWKFMKRKPRDPNYGLCAECN